MRPTLPHGSRLPGRFRGALVAAVLGGAVLVPSAACAQAMADSAASDASTVATTATVTASARQGSGGSGDSSDAGGSSDASEEPSGSRGAASPTDEPYFLITGGVMAGAGAAGLMYPAVRRGRTDD